MHYQLPPIPLSQPSHFDFLFNITNINKTEPTPNELLKTKIPIPKRYQPIFSIKTNPFKKESNITTQTKRKPTPFLNRILIGSNINQKNLYTQIKFQSFPFYKYLSNYLHDNGMTVKLAQTIFPKVIKSEIDYIIEKEEYTNDTKLKEAFLQYKQEELKCFLSEFEPYYNKTQINSNENSIIDINSSSFYDDDKCIDINITEDNQYQDLFHKIKELRKYKLKKGKLCKFCLIIHTKITRHIFAFPQCHQFISTLSSLKSSQEQQLLIIDQIRYCYKHLKAKSFSECKAFYDKCYTSLNLPINNNSIQTLQLLLKEIAAHINKL